MLFAHATKGRHFALNAIRIGDNVTVGATAVVMSEVMIGDRAVVSAGAVVSKRTRICARRGSGAACRRGACEPPFCPTGPRSSPPKLVRGRGFPACRDALRTRPAPTQRGATPCGRKWPTHGSWGTARSKGHGAFNAPGWGASIFFTVRSCGRTASLRNHLIEKVTGSRKLGDRSFRRLWRVRSPRLRTVEFFYSPALRGTGSIHNHLIEQKKLSLASILLHLACPSRQTLAGKDSWGQTKHHSQDRSKA